MNNSALDVPALALAIVLSGLIAGSLFWADRGANMRRVWFTGAVLAAVLMLAGLVDLLTASPRETPVLTAILGATLPVLGMIGVTRLSRRMRPVPRLALLVAGAMVLLLGGLLLGATLLSRIG